MLGQLDALRRDVQGKDSEIRDLHSELRLRPNLAQMNSKAQQIEQLCAQLEAQRKENDQLHTEVMDLRNQT